MTYDQIALDGALVMTPREDRIDLSNADPFRDSLLAALSSASKLMIVDLSRVEYISSAGLRSLMIALKAAKAEDKAFAVASLQPLTKEIFAISRLDLVFSLFDGVRDAIQGLAPHALAEFDAL
jgi:anti-sigma B factor antagonist